MACELTAGKLLDCKDKWAGIKEVFFLQHEDLATGVVFDATTGEIEDLPTIANLYRVQVEKNTANADCTINPNEQGAVTFTHQVTFQMRALSTTTRKEIALWAKNRLAIFVRDMNDNIWLYGRERGMEVASGTIATGAALGDFNGYTLAFQSEETQQPVRVENFTTNPFDNAAFAVTVNPAY